MTDAITEFLEQAVATQAVVLDALLTEALRLTPMSHWSTLTVIEVVNYLRDPSPPRTVACLWPPPSA